VPTPLSGRLTNRCARIVSELAELGVAVQKA
jgi:hypothetical protein